MSSKKTETAETAETTKTAETAEIVAFSGFEMVDSFKEVYGGAVQRAVARLNENAPKLEHAIDMMEQEDEDAPDKIMELLSMFNSDKQGVYSDDEMEGLPQIKVNTGMGSDDNRPEDCPRGHWYSLGEPLGNEFEFAILGITKGYVNFVDGVNSPICRSSDGKLGSGLGEPSCKMCVHKDWVDGVPPQCAETLTFHVISRELDRIGTMTFKRSSLKTAKKAMRSAKLATNIWSKWFKASAESKKGDGKSWVEAMLTASGQVPPAMQDVFGQLASSIELKFLLPGIERSYASVANVQEVADALASPAEETGTVEASEDMTDI